MTDNKDHGSAPITECTLSVYTGNEPFFSFFSSAEVALSTLRLSIEDRCLFQSSDLASQMVTLRREFQHNGKFPEALQVILRITNQLQARVQNWEREVQNRERARREMTGTRLQRLRVEVSQVRGKIQMTERVLAKLEIVLHQLQAEEAERLEKESQSANPTQGEPAEPKENAEASLEGESSVSEQVTEARKHREAFDYHAAIQAIESIPEPLRSAQVKEYLQTWTAEQRESDALIDTIKARIGERSFEELLPLVERALSLRGDREDLRRLHDQLREWEAKQTHVCYEAFARAQSLLAEGNAKDAYQAVKGFAANRLAVDQSSFREKLEHLLMAEKRIAAMVKDAKSGGEIDLIKVTALYPKVLAYLEGNPQHTAMRKLRDDLLALLKRPE